MSMYAGTSGDGSYVLKSALRMPYDMVLASPRNLKQWRVAHHHPIDIPSMELGSLCPNLVDS